MTKPYQLLVFDWDGTLMDSAAKIVSCLQVASERAELPLRTDQQYRYIIGLGLREAMQNLYPQAGAQQMDVLMATYREQFLYENKTGSILFAGVTDMLVQLEAQGYLLAVATGKARPGLDRVLAETGLSKTFHVTRCADETASKPDPLMLKEVLSDLQLQPEQALMIGDTGFDLEMAHRANMSSVAVSHGAHTLEELQQHTPLVILEHITHLAEWLSEAGERYSQAR